MTLYLLLLNLPKCLVEFFEHHFIPYRAAQSYKNVMQFTDVSCICDFAFSSSHILKSTKKQVKLLNNIFNKLFQLSQYAQNLIILIYNQYRNY